MRHLKIVLVATLLIGLVALSGVAKTAPTPEGDVILTASGSIALTNSDETFEFDLDMIKGLAQEIYESEDPWSGKQEFTGVRVKTLLDYLGFPKDAEKVVFTAEDGEVTEIPVEHAMQYPLMLAYQTGGYDLPHRMGGPLKLMWPWNDEYEKMEELYPPKEQKNYWIEEMEVVY